jgi:type IV pilus assembly protein PilV
MKRRELGFTLVEVLMAVVVMAIALTGVAMMSSSTIVADTGGRQQAAATTLAQEKLEQLRSLRRSDSAWDAGTHSEYVEEDGTVGSGMYTREWEVEEDYNGKTNLSRVMVTVSWENGEVILSSLYW